MANIKVDGPTPTIAQSGGLITRRSGMVPVGGRTEYVPIKRLDARRQQGGRTRRKTDHHHFGCDIVFTPEEPEETSQARSGEKAKYMAII